MLKHEGTTFTNILRYEYHDDQYTFGAEEGFMIAFGVIDEESDDGRDMLGRPMEEYLNMRVDTFDVQFEDYAVE